GHGGVPGADTAAGLDAERITDGPAHQLDRVCAGAAGRMEAGGGLDEVGAGVRTDSADLDDLLIGQCRGLDDDLQQGGRNRVPNGVHVGLHRGPVSGDRVADVDDHVDLVGAVGDRTGRLCGL